MKCLKADLRLYLENKIYKTGGDLVKYKVNVEELLSRIVEVEAENEEEAEDKVREMYMNEDICD